MLALRVFLSSRRNHIYRVHSRWLSSSQSPNASSPKHSPPNPTTDALGLPLFPSWSVHDLISSYPSPTLSDAHLRRLHDLAALIPPQEGTAEFEQLKQEMEVLVRLVEAVRMAPEGAPNGDSLLDSRAWASGMASALDQPGRDITFKQPAREEKGHRDGPPSGQALLNHAQRKQFGFYLVDSSRTKP